MTINTPLNVHAAVLQVPTCVRHNLSVLIYCGRGDAALMGVTMGCPHPSVAMGDLGDAGTLLRLKCRRNMECG